MIYSYMEKMRTSSMTSGTPTLITLFQKKVDSPERRPMLDPATIQVEIRSMTPERGGSPPSIEVAAITTEPSEQMTGSTSPARVIETSLWIRSELKDNRPRTWAARQDTRTSGLHSTWVLQVKRHKDSRRRTQELQDTRTAGQGPDNF